MTQKGSVTSRCLFYVQMKKPEAELHFTRIIVLYTAYGMHHIAPANKYVNAVIPTKAGHAVKLLHYPEKHWMPEQVRHDAFGYLVARLILPEPCM